MIAGRVAATGGPDRKSSISTAPAVSRLISATSKYPRRFSEIVTAISTVFGSRTRRWSARASAGCTLAASAEGSELMLRVATRATSAAASRAVIFLARAATASSSVCACAVKDTNRRTMPRPTSRIITNGNWAGGFGRLPSPVPRVPSSHLLPDRAHPLQHIIREEKLSVVRHHHDLHLIRQLLRNDLLDQQRIVGEHRSFQLHLLRVGSGRAPDAILFGLVHQFTFLEFRLAVDHFRLRHRFGVLHRGFLARLGFQPRLLDLLLLERQRVLHGVGLRLGLEHGDRGLTLGGLDLARF